MCLIVWKLKLKPTGSSFFLKRKHLHTEKDKNSLVGVEGDLLQSRSHQLLHRLFVPPFRYRLTLHLRLWHQHAHKHVTNIRTNCFSSFREVSHVRWEWMLPWPCPLSRTGRMFLWSVDPECQMAAGRSHGPSDWSFGWEAPRNPEPGSTPLFCHYEAHPRPQTQTGSECTHMQEVKVLRDSQEAVFNMLKRQCFKIYCVCVCLVSTFNLNADAALLKAMWMSLKSAELLLTKRRAWFNTGAVSIWVAVCERDRGNNIWKNI